MPVSVSEGHSRANLNRTPAESIVEVRRLMDWVKAQPRRMPVVAGCSTAFGCSIDGVVPTAQTVALCKGLADAGVDQIMLADTVGYAHPAQVKEVVRAVREAIGPVLYGLHLHDTWGSGIANALAGLEEGIRAFDSCLAGLGGCPYAPGASGNVVTEDLVFMLESMGFATGIDLPKLLHARDLLHAGLPDEKLHGQVPKAGIPKRSGRPPSRSRRIGQGGKVQRIPPLPWRNALHCFALPPPSGHRPDQRCRGCFGRPDGDVIVANELGDVGRALLVLSGRIEPHPTIADNELIGLQVGRLQRHLNLLRRCRTGTVDRIRQHEERLHDAPARIAHVATGLCPKQCVHLLRHAVWLTRRPGAAI